MLPADAHFRACIKTGDNRQPVKINRRDFVPNDTAIAELSCSSNVHHGVEASTIMRIHQMGPKR